MQFDHVLANVTVKDISKAGLWYERLFGRPADNNPMDSLLEWKLTESAWLQVSSDKESLTGKAQVCLAVQDLRQAIAELRDRGIVLGELQPVSDGVEVATVNDPDGNLIIFIGNFMEKR